MLQSTNDIIDVFWNKRVSMTVNPLKTTIRNYLLIIQLLASEPSYREHEIVFLHLSEKERTVYKISYFII